jgi:heme exporter protein A
MTALVAENLHVFRGLRHVLQGLSFQADAATCVQIMGANGSGKTTLLRAVAGLLEPESGRVLWQGRDTRVDRDLFHRSLGFLGHEAPLKQDLTALENIRFAASIRRRVTSAECASALERVGAAALADRLSRTLSAGQRRRIAFAGLTLARAKLWLLDEPQTNLDAAGQGLVLSLMREHLADGGIVIAAVHQEFALDSESLRRISLGGRE